MKNINELTEKEIDEILETTGKFKEDLEKTKEIEVIRELENYETEKEDYSISDEIKELHGNIEDLKKKKDSIIKAVIGQMYKGVLIDNKLSIRNGEIYSYKHHNNSWLSLSSIKKDLMDNLHQVKSKITAKNLEILEFILDYVDEAQLRIEKEFKISFKMPKSYWFCFLGNSYKHEEALHLSFQKISVITFINGKSEFFEDEKSNYSTGISARQEALLIKRYEKEIKQLFKTHIEEKNTEITNLKDEIEVIKAQAGELLIVAQLKKDNNKNLL